MPAWPYSYYNMIETFLLKNGNLEEARNNLNIAILNTKENFSELKIKLFIYEKKFLEALHEAEKSKPDDFTYKEDKYLYMALINKYLNRKIDAGIYYDSILVGYEKGQTIDMNNPLVHSFAGVAYAGKEMKEKAIEEAEETRELLKDYIKNEGREIINLALIYTITGENEKAINTIEYLLKTPSLFSVKMLQLDPAWKPLMELPEYNKMIVKYSVN